MLKYFYHLKPDSLEGNDLLPASAWESVNPQRFLAYLNKYQDHPQRAQLPYQHIPVLECRWMDVVFFSPIHPKLIYDQWRALGGRLFPRQETWLRFSAELLDEFPAVLYSRSSEKATLQIEPKEVQCLNQGSYQELKHLPQFTLDWYAHLIQEGREGAWFHGVPHVLIQAAVPISRADSIAISINSD